MTFQIMLTRGFLEWFADYQNCSLAEAELLAQEIINQMFVYGCLPKEPEPEPAPLSQLDLFSNIDKTPQDMI